MKRLLLLFALLFPCLSFGQAFSQVQNNETTGTNVVTVTLTVPAGHFGVFCTSQGTNNTDNVTISDSTGGSNTWTQTTSGYVSQGVADRGACFYSNIASQVTTVTATWAVGDTTRCSAILFDLTSITSSSPQDTSVNSTATGATGITSGTFSTANANDILVFYGRAGSNQSTTCSNWTAGSGYTIPNASPGNGCANRVGMEYKVVAATQSSVTATITGSASANWEGIAMAFKASGGAAATCAPTLGLLGVSSCGD